MYPPSSTDLDYTNQLGRRKGGEWAANPGNKLEGLGGGSVPPAWTPGQSDLPSPRAAHSPRVVQGVQICRLVVKPWLTMRFIRRLHDTGEELLDSKSHPSVLKAVHDKCKAGETGYPRENLPTSGIGRRDSHMRKSWGGPAGNRTLFVPLNHYTVTTPDAVRARLSAIANSSATLATPRHSSIFPTILHQVKLSGCFIRYCLVAILDARQQLDVFQPDVNDCYTPPIRQQYAVGQMTNSRFQGDRRRQAPCCSWWDYTSQPIATERSPPQFQRLFLWQRYLFPRKENSARSFQFLPLESATAAVRAPTIFTMRTTILGQRENICLRVQLGISLMFRSPPAAAIVSAADVRRAGSLRTSGVSRRPDNTSRRRPSRAPVDRPLTMRVSTLLSVLAPPLTAIRHAGLGENDPLSPGPRSRQLLPPPGVWSRFGESGQLRKVRSLIRPLYSHVETALRWPLTARQPLCHL
ncbi:hypothetical protein PR048_010032 [Dryococelus australis]|uniref:Uncharacterized protein n=1 Tax=Dryococelus australis TaxID=614101 RepID=A0ABQ9I1L3_9NEOP|nr:hypothetical protein PR048_010032 [Dryococelus australis]